MLSAILGLGRQGQGQENSTLQIKEPLRGHYKIVKKITACAKRQTPKHRKTPNKQQA
jgi:hypothetical protein